MMYFATKEEMISDLSKLTTTRMKMDKFFSMFLDKFEKKMNPDRTDTPIWNLYKAKMKEYGELQVKIKTLEFRIKQV